jgi:hypothetical protein
MDSGKTYYRVTLDFSGYDPSEPPAQMIWAIWGPNTICLAGDYDSPNTAFPSAAAMTQFISEAEAQTPGLYCHSRYR